MNKPLFNKREPLRFKQFRQKGYALFSCLGKEVVICALSVATLSPATAATSASLEAVAADTAAREAVMLDEIIIHASRAPLTASQAATNVSVIMRDDIRRMAVTSVNDVLKMSPGVDVRQRGGYGIQTDITINGGTFDQITILLNGVNISSPQTGHNAADFPVSLSDIERIEVLEGAAARVFGSSAFNGAVNIVTRGADSDGVRLALSSGSFGTVDCDAGITLSTGAVTNHLSGGFTRSDGGSDNSDFLRRRFYYTGTCRSSCIDMQWQCGLSSQDFGANTFYSSKYNNQYEETRRFLVSARADIMPWGEHGLTLTPSAYWHRDNDHYQLTRGMTGADNGENYHRTDVYGFGLDAHFEWLLGKTAAGIDISHDHILSTVYGHLMAESEWKDIHGSERQYDHKGSRTNTNLFLEHNIIVGGFTLSAGLLANRNTGLDNDYRFYPGIDISYHPNDNWKLFASWNKALRVPTYTDLYTSNAAQQGDPDLRPEKISTFKIGSRYRNHWLSATASAFYSHGTDIIDWVYTSAESTQYQALNIGKLDNMGVSADVTLDISRLWRSAIVTRVKAGYAFIHQKHDTEHAIYGSLYALEYLRHKATVQIDHRLFSRRLTASWAVRWQQRMNNYSPYTKIDLQIAWNADAYSLFVKADNLTCHHYYDIGGVRQPGLWIMAGGSVNINI